MDNLSYIIFICIVLALGMMTPLLERKTRGTIIFMIVGVCSCLFISEINYLILEAFHGDYLYVTTTMTPVTEEIIKALPIFFIALVRDLDRRTLTTYAFAVGVGFALLENMIILVQSIESVSVLWALVRGFGSGLVHGLCTVMVGYGISYNRTKRKLFVAGTFALLAVAITYHATYNLLILSEYRYAGILLPVLTYIPLIIGLRKRLFPKEKEQSNA